MSGRGSELLTIEMAPAGPRHILQGDEGIWDHGQRAISLMLGASRELHWSSHTWFVL